MLKSIYSIKDDKNKRIYIGETLNLGDRWLKHKEDLEKGTHSNKELQKYYNEKDFKFTIEIMLDNSLHLTSTMQKILLLILERKTIQKYEEMGYEVLNVEDSLSKVLSEEKKLFSSDDEILSTDKVLDLVNTINKRLKSYYKQIDSLLYRDIKSNKISKSDIDECIKILEEE